MSMQLSYGGENLHEVGDLRIVPSKQFEPPESPQRIIHTLNVEVDIFKDNYHAGKTIRDDLSTALRTQHQQLVWSNPAITGDEGTYVDRTATVVSENLPANPNEWGNKYQKLVVVFRYVENLDADETNNLVCEYTPVAGSAVNLGQVRGFNEEFSTERFSEYQDERRRTRGSVSISGRKIVDEDNDLSERRTALQSAHTEIRDAFDSKSGTLTYAAGSVSFFSATVRIVRANIVVNEAVNGIDWSIDAEYTKFPTESSFATIEYTIKDDTDRETGQTTRTFSGTINAKTESDATTQLGTTRDHVFLGIDKVLISKSETPNVVHSDDNSGDTGITFVSLEFDESYLIFHSSSDTTLNEKADANAKIYSATYAKSVSKDNVDLLEETTITGSVYGDRQKLEEIVDETPGNFLAQLIEGMSITGEQVKRDVSIDYEYRATPQGHTNNEGWQSGGALSTDGSNRRGLKLDFTLEFEKTIPGDGILESEINMSVQYAGNRFVVHDIPGGESVIQHTGTSTGTLRFSGHVVAKDQTGAFNYVQTRMNALMPRWTSGSSRATRPPRFSYSYTYPRKVAGDIGTFSYGSESISQGTANQKNVKLEFEAEEILKDVSFS